MRCLEEEDSEEVHAVSLLIAVAEEELVAHEVLVGVVSR